MKAGRPILRSIAAVVALCLVGSAASPAAPTATVSVAVRELSADQAAALVARQEQLYLPLVTTLAPDAATILAAKVSLLELPALATLTPETARALVREGRCYDLELDGIRRMSLETARELARHAGRLRLAGLEQLPADLAAVFGDGGGRLTGLALPLPPGTPAESLRGLARVRHNLEFTGPVVITPELVEAFAGYRKYLTFSGPVASITPDVARSLTFPGVFHVTGPIVLPDETAEVLTARGGVYITGLTRITPAVARMLAVRSDSICLDRLRELDAASAAVLATHAGPLIDISAVESLSLEAAVALTGFRGRLCANGIRTLPRDVGMALVRHPSWLELGLTTLTPETAAVLATHRHGFSLPHLRTLPLASAQALAGKEGPLELHRLQRISPEALESLEKKSDLKLPPRDTLEIGPDPEG